MAGVVSHLARRRTKPLIIRFDWTDVRDFHTLMAAACIGARAGPLLWVSFRGSKLRRSQNALEERLLRRLKGLLPPSARVIILADRGFGRAAWAAVGQELGFGHVVRIKPDVTVSCSRYRGVLRKYPVRRGMAHVLCGVDDRKDRRMRPNVVVRWQPGRPRKRDEPWYLMTNLDDRAERLCELDTRRMSVEELFRNGKSRRNGQSLRHTRIGSPDRFDRFLLVVALSYSLSSSLLVGLGLAAKLDHDPSAWCTNRHARECSVFTIGKAVVERFNYSPDHCRLQGGLKPSPSAVGSRKSAASSRSGIHQPRVPRLLQPKVLQHSLH